MFDVHSQKILAPGFIAVEGGKISYSGTVRPIRRPDDIDIPLTGHYLLPGLVDSHVHLCFDSTASDSVATLMAQDDGDLATAMAERAARAAYRGVTTVRDLGDRGFLARELARRDDPTLPTIVASGPPLTSSGGHCHYLGGEVAGRKDALAAVDRHSDFGVDLIKIMVTGGILTRNSDPGQLQFDSRTVEAVVRRAHGHGLPVAAHAHSAEGIRLALHAGVDTIEHCTFADEDRFDLDEALVEEIAESDCWVCPTFVARPGVQWEKRHFTWRASVLRRLYAAGVRIAAGTDAGVKTGLHHESACWAVPSLVSLGIPPETALVMATRDAASACGLGGRKGCLTAGADADVIAVPRDPLADPGVLAHPSLVMVRGNVLIRPGQDG